MMGFGGFLVELAGADLRLGIPSLCNFQQYQNPLGVVGSRISLRFQLIGFGVWPFQRLPIHCQKADWGSD